MRINLWFLGVWLIVCLLSVELSKKGGNFQQAAQNLLVGLSVLTRYNNKTYRIDEILFDQNPQATFDCQGKPISFVQYYKEHYDIDIKDKEQPLLLNRWAPSYVHFDLTTVNVSFVSLLKTAKKSCRQRRRDGSNLPDTWAVLLDWIGRSFKKQLQHDARVGHPH